MKLSKVKRLPLKVGEGLHTHAVVSEKEDIVVLDKKDNTESIKFQLSNTTMLDHEEHASIPLEKGTYSTPKIGQQEFDPFPDGGTVRERFD